MNDERDTDPSLEERVEISTVARPGLVALLFTAVTAAILAAIFWITGTPRRWLAFVIAAVLGVALYLAFRK